MFKPTVNEVANDVKIKTVHAGIVWDATVRQYPELETVSLLMILAAAAVLVVVRVFGRASLIAQGEPM